MSSISNIVSFFILLSVIILIRADTADNVNSADFSEAVELSTILPDEFSKDTKRTQRFILKNLWKDLFADCNCNNGAGGKAPQHAEPQLWGHLNPLKKLDPLGLFSQPPCGTSTYATSYGNGYHGQGPSYGYEDNTNYNEDVPAPPSYEKPTTVYEKPQEEYVKPSPVYEKTEEVYEKPIPTYAKPALVYDKKDCVADKCGPRPQVVYQPIIYVAPNMNGGKDKIYVESKETSDEVEHSKDSIHTEPVIYEKEQKEEYYEQPEQNFNPPPPPPPPVAPLPHSNELPTGPPTTCTQSCGHLTFPILGLAIPSTQAAPQIINYNVPAPYNGCANGNYQSCASSNPITYYNTDPYASAYNSHYPSGHVNYGYPRPTFPSSPIILTHADQPYRACPELFTEYNYHLQHLSSNKLY